LDTITKSPIEKFPIHFNFSNDLLASETIVSQVLTCVNSATGVSSKTTIVDSEAIVSPEVNVVLKAGTEDDEHSIQCVATTNLGNTYDRDLLLMVQSVVTDAFSKQPSDKILFDVDYSRRLETGDTISTATCLATKESDGTDVSATVAPSVEILTPKIGVHVAAGTDGKTYLLGVRATTVAAYVYEKNIRMTVQEVP
jgi:hypothetical protein